MEQNIVPYGSDKEYEMLFNIRDLAMLFGDMLACGYGKKSETLDRIRSEAERGIGLLTGHDRFS